MWEFEFQVCTALGCKIHETKQTTVSHANHNANVERKKVKQHNEERGKTGRLGEKPGNSRTSALFGHGRYMRVPSPIV